eukprot:TRINITY_DN7172_c0_g1_i1.p1 TRINITY_DN7172_c0_g1~~TRINITY_DN7172_c0_g1_i1.p1  ORF type:complete len:450 (+),score=112.76 TRINITY_DN7172_c0_g1_i1:116-1465(+)
MANNNEKSMLDYCIIQFSTSTKPDLLQEVEICSSLSCRALKLRICQLVKEKMEKTRLILINQEIMQKPGGKSRGKTVDFQVLDEDKPIYSIELKGTKVFLEVLEEGCKEWPMDAFLKQPEAVVPPEDPSLAPMPNFHRGGVSFEPPPHPNRSRPVIPPNYSVHSPLIGRKPDQNQKEQIAQQMWTELSSFFATQGGPQKNEPSVEDVEISAAIALSKEEAQKEIEKENAFQDRLLCERGFAVKKMPNDGNCLFAAIADQVYGEPDLHMQLREACMDYMEANAEHFWQFVSGEEFDHYLARKRQKGVYGNNPEIQALSELIERPIEVYNYDTIPMNTFQDRVGSERPVRISYHNNNHYNSLLSTLDDSSIVPPPSPSELLYRKGIAPKAQNPTPTHPLPTASKPSSSSSKPAPSQLTHEKDLYICPQCQSPSDNFEELQIHILTVCGVEF